MVLIETYRKLSIPSLVTNLARTTHNILIIGTKDSWLINARAVRQVQFVGTKIALGISGKSKKPSTWNRL